MRFEYDVMYDCGKIMCFVGNSYPHQVFLDIFQSKRPTEVVSYEDILDKDPVWFQQRQFMSVLSDRPMQIKIVRELEKHNVDWFSLIGTTSCVAPDAHIGKNVHLAHYSYVYFGGSHIGDHCSITTHCALSHGVKLDEFCFISPFCYLCFCELGKGVVVGHRSSVFGRDGDPIKIAEFSNLLMESRVNMSLDRTGTYHGHRLQNNISSLDKKIL